ncbi:MAG: HD domain-containing protein [Ruminococcaceae bacterium]|nr:HD domain-containing protein [Oscillospiraceae bacterium]
MRALYLIRHGEPAFPDGKRVCLGQMDLPLSAEGARQAAETARYIEKLPRKAIYTSPLARCRETAAHVQAKLQVLPGLTEVDMGEWDGLSFDEIRARWPEEYEKRGENLFDTAAPGGESFRAVGARARAALQSIQTDDSTRGLVLIAHSAVNRALCAELTGLAPEAALELPQPYGSVTQLLISRDAVWLGAAGKLPQDLPKPIPDEAECRALLREAKTPERAFSHCIATAELAHEFWEILDRRGVKLNREMIVAGAMLHDILRAEPRHDLAGARWLTTRGYAALGAVVGNHMVLQDGTETAWNESMVVYLADKLVQGTRRVSLEERYFPSDQKPERKPYAKQYYVIARALYERFERERECEAL